MQQNELPEGWANTRLFDITLDVKNVKPENEPDRDFKYIDISSIDNRRFVISEYKEFKGRDAPSRARRPIKANDVLFSNVRTYLKNIAIVGEEYTNQLCSTGFTVLRPSIGVLPKYLFIFVQTDEFIDSVTPQQRGSQYPATSDTVVKAAQIPLPPLPEQHRIVTAIEALFARLDATNERLDRVPGIMKAFRQAVLAAACDGRLTEDWREEQKDLPDARELLEQIRKEREEAAKAFGKKIKPVKPLTEEEIVELPKLPEGWAYSALEQIGEWSTGSTPSRKKKEYFGGNISWVKSGDLNDGIVTDTEEKITQEGLDNCSAKLLPAGFISIALYGATIGKLGVLNIDAATNQACANCQVNPVVINRMFLFYYLLSQREELIKAGQGGAQPNLTNKIVREWPLILPPLPEQQEIVRRVDALFAFADSIEAKVAVAREKTERLRQSILAKAFSGELVPTEAELARQEGREYESAEVLLKRIKAEGKSGKK